MTARSLFWWAVHIPATYAVNLCPDHGTLCKAKHPIINMVVIVHYPRLYCSNNLAAKKAYRYSVELSYACLNGTHEFITQLELTAAQLLLQGFI